MRFSQLGFVAALAVTEAFLLPPEISQDDIDIIKTLPFEDAVAVDGRVIEIACPDCPVSNGIEDKMHTTQVDSVLKLDFRLAHEDIDRLYLNDMQIYPVNPSAPNFMGPLMAAQSIKKDDDTWEYSSSPKLGYAMSVERPTLSNTDGLGLVSIHLEIIEVADVYVTSMPTVEIKLVETPSNKLMIGDAIITKHVSGPAEECSTLLCKWRAIIADRLSALKKGCGSKSSSLPGAARVGAPRKPGHKTHGHHGRPHGARPGPHRPFRHHHKHHGITRVLKGIVMHVVIPILIGIMMGITASLLGMVVGHIAIFIWRALFRRGKRQQYIKVQQIEIVAEEDVTDETKGFLEHQGPPPVYEDVVIDEKASA